MNEQASVTQLPLTLFRLPFDIAQAGLKAMNDIMAAVAGGRSATQTGDSPSHQYYRAQKARSAEQLSALLTPDCVGIGPIAAFRRTTTAQQFIDVLREQVWPITNDYILRTVVSNDNEGVLVYDWSVKIFPELLRVAVLHSYRNGRINQIELFFDPVTFNSPPPGA